MINLINKKHRKLPLHFFVVLEEYLQRDEMGVAKVIEQLVPSITLNETVRFTWHKTMINVSHHRCVWNNVRRLLRSYPRWGFWTSIPLTFISSFCCLHYLELNKFIWKFNRQIILLFLHEIRKQCYCWKLLLNYVAQVFTGFFI